jgi:hypothetical protein
MQKDQMHELLAAITERVLGEDKFSGCAPVTLTIGFIAEPSNQVKADGIVITNAPPAILEVVNDFVAKEKDSGHMVFAQPGHGGLLIF